MQVTNETSDQILCQPLVETLGRLRARRNFNAKTWIDAKAWLLNDYMKRHDLKACVVGVSGGVDSALVLAIACHAAKMDATPIARVIPLLMPVFAPDGATNQKQATESAHAVALHLGLEPFQVDLTQSHDATKKAVDNALGIEGKAWASGQLVSYARTPALYYTTSLLTQSGLNAVVLGTTNRDEGGYLGYFGKASDGMVDIQLISDLHKSEVYAAARELGLPAAVLEAIPSGDMYDGRPDTEVFGAPYDFVELYLSMLCLSEELRGKEQQSWTPEAHAQFEKLAARLEKLHTYNAHKYAVGSPAVHLDIYPAAVPGGWQTGPKDKPVPAQINNKYTVGPFDFPLDVLDEIRKRPLRMAEKLPSHHVKITEADDINQDSVLVVDSLLSTDEVRRVYGTMMSQSLVPVGYSGIRSEFNPETDPVGSVRASAYCPDLARTLWERLAPHMDSHLYLPEGSYAESRDYGVWRAVGINALLRFIRYDCGGRQITHYDSPFDYGDGRKTLKSIVIYLTDYEEGMGGLMRYIKEPQKHLPYAGRDFSDWKRMANDDEVLSSVAPKAGRALVFGQRVLHDGQTMAPGSKPKLYIRGDIIFDKISGA